MDVKLFIWQANSRCANFEFRNYGQVVHPPFRPVVVFLEEVASALVLAVNFSSVEVELPLGISSMLADLVQ